MTWLLINTELRYSSLDKIKEAATSRGSTIAGEWSDEQIAEASQKVQKVYDDPKYANTDEFDYDAVFRIFAEFLPDPLKEPIKDAL